MKNRFFSSRIAKRIFTESVLYDLADHLDNYEGWLHWLLTKDVDCVRPWLLECAFNQLGPSLMFSIVLYNVPLNRLPGSRSEF